MWRCKNLLSAPGPGSVTHSHCSQRPGSDSLVGRAKGRCSKGARQGQLPQAACTPHLHACHHLAVLCQVDAALLWHRVTNPDVLDMVGSQLSRFGRVLKPQQNNGLLHCMLIAGLDLQSICKGQPPQQQSACLALTEGVRGASDSPQCLPIAVMNSAGPEDSIAVRLV